MLIYLILGTVIFCLMGFLAFWDEYEYDGKVGRVIKTGSAIAGMTFVGFLIGIVAAFLIGSIGGLFFDTVPVLKETKPISALQDNYEGSYRGLYMRRGTDNYAYAYVDDIGIKVATADIDNSHVIYTDADPYMETYGVKFKSGIVKIFFNTWLYNTNYRFYVPQGTVIEDFSVDLE